MYTKNPIEVVYIKVVNRSLSKMDEKQFSQFMQDLLVISSAPEDFPSVRGTVLDMPALYDDV